MGQIEPSVANRAEIERLPLPVHQAPTGGSLGYIPQIDGLRGVAIIAVLLFHLHIPGFSLGWAGVELFFVISGFLITRILLNTRNGPHYFRTFYIRRTLRIFPIYYLVIGLYFAAAWWLGWREELRAIPYYLFYVQTVPQITSDFSIAPTLSHTWTLAIEEQFYLIWPAVVFLLCGRRLVIVMIAACVMSLALRFVFTVKGSPTLAYAWLPVQLDCLLAGAFLAIGAGAISRQLMTRICRLLTVVGFVACAVIVSLNGASQYWHPATWGLSRTSPILLTSMALCFAGLVGLAAGGDSGMRWLSWKPLVRTGKISYGIYMYHPFVIGLGYVIRDSIGIQAWEQPQRKIAMVALAVFELLVIFLVAEASWRLIERPLNKWKDRLRSKTNRQEGVVAS